MKPTRRGFLSLLGAAVPAIAFDPERALWRPDSKLISIPSGTIYTPGNAIIDPWIDRGPWQHWAGLGDYQPTDFEVPRLGGLGFGMCRVDL